MEMEMYSIEKTAFVTSSGLYEFVCLPFELKNSAASFQRLVEHVLREVKGKCCMVCVDNNVVYCSNINEHFQQVFACLHKTGLTLNIKKCNFIHCSHFNFLDTL